MLLSSIHIKKASSLASAALLAVAALTGCGGGGGSGSRPAPVVDGPATPTTGADNCNINGQKAFVADVADDWYLWYDEVAQVTSGDFATADDFLRALTAPLAPDGRDPGFSYVTTKAEDDARSASGAFVGFGFRFDIDAANRFFFIDVYENGPAGDAGINRGDQLVAIDLGNGFETIADLAARGATLDELFGPNETGVERGFRVRSGIAGDDAATLREVVVAKRQLNTPPLAGGPQLIPREGLSPVGYLNLRAFTSSANEPLADAIGQFGDAGVTDLVIDLRYNGGGLLDVTDRFLNLLGGSLAESEVSFRLAHNDKRSEEDVAAVFTPGANTLEPLRIAFITTGASASASELLINSLAPHIEVVLVGEDTLGKAVGQYAFDQPGCETRLRLVSFELVNGEDQGGYYTGLVDTGRFTLCAALDDIRRPFGDPREASLNTALTWLNTGACAGTVTGSALGNRSLEGDPWALAAHPPGIFGRSVWVQ